MFLILSLSVSLPLKAGMEFGVDFTSRFIWRGLDLFSLKNNNDKPALQPNITFVFGKSGFSLQLFSTFSFNKEDWKSLDELDLIAAYDFNAGKNLSLSLGFIHYGWYFGENFSFSENSFQEIYFSTGLPKFPLGPRITFYYYIKKKGETGGWYLMGEVGHGFRLSDWLDMELSASLGYNHHHMWMTGPNPVSGFSDFNIGVSFPLKCTKVGVTPFMKMAFILMDEVNPDVEHEIWFGVSMVF